MSDRVQAHQTGRVAAVPRPPGDRPRAGSASPESGPVPPGWPAAAGSGPVPPGRPAAPGSGPVQLQRGGICRATVRDALDAALRGIQLGSRDRQFLSRLVHWDKRNAAAVASLLWRARLAGRGEAALSARQLEIVLAALEDAAAYRISGPDATSCWDCGNIPGGRCADHARDADRARACSELAAQLAAGTATAAAAGELQRPTGVHGFRRRTSVAS